MKPFISNIFWIAIKITIPPIWLSFRRAPFRKRCRILLSRMIRSIFKLAVCIGRKIKRKLKIAAAIIKVQSKLRRITLRPCITTSKNLRGKIKILKCQGRTPQFGKNARWLLTHRKAKEIRTKENPQRSLNLKRKLNPKARKSSTPPSPRKK